MASAAAAIGTIMVVVGILGAFRYTYVCFRTHLVLRRMMLATGDVGLLERAVPFGLFWQTLVDPERHVPLEGKPLVEEQRTNALVWCLFVICGIVGGAIQDFVLGQ